MNHDSSKYDDEMYDLIVDFLNYYNSTIVSLLVIDWFFFVHVSNTSNKGP